MGFQPPPGGRAPGGTRWRRYGIPVLGVAAGGLVWLSVSVRLALFVFVSVLLALLVEAASRQGRRADSSARAARDAEQRWQSLVADSARFRGLFESSLDATMVADDEGRFVEVNPAACALFGLPKGKLIGCGIWEFSSSRAAFDAAWVAFLGEGQMRGEWELHLPDGTRREVEFSASARVTPGRHLSMLRDISERRRAQRSSEFLARATRMLASSLEERETARVLASLAVSEIADWCAVDVRDERGQVYRLALAAGDARRQEAVWELTRGHPPDGPAGAALTEVLRTGQPWLCPELDGDAVQRLARDDEHLRLLCAAARRSVMVIPLASRGCTMGALWFGRTEGRAPFGPYELRLARELAERAGVALENARLYQEAQQANRVKDDFLALLSHELRTPLNAIVGWTHLLRTGELDAATSQRALTTIDRNARLQSQLIADILDVSRIVSGTLRIENAPVDLGHVVTAALDVVRPVADAKGVRLFAEAMAPGTTLLGDAGRLQQVAHNLLHNAVKFTNAGGEVHAGLRRAGAAAELVVQDTGAGISAEFLPHVFDRFRQGDSSTTRPHGGLGLGLAIARHLVEAHGGSVEAASRGTGLGATFTVRLPVLAVTRASDVNPRASLMPMELDGIRVLVVDDHADGANVLGTTLERAGARVSRAATSREAFACIEEFRPHVLVSDRGLPDEDGFALVARVQSLAAEHGKMVPAIAVAGHVRAEETSRAPTAEFQRLSKPIDPLELTSAVAQLTGLRVPAFVLD